MQLQNFILLSILAASMRELGQHIGVVKTQIKQITDGSRLRVTQVTKALGEACRLVERIPFSASRMTEHSARFMRNHSSAIQDEQQDNVEIGGNPTGFHFEGTPIVDNQTGVVDVFAPYIEEDRIDSPEIDARVNELLAKKKLAEMRLDNLGERYEQQPEPVQQLMDETQNAVEFFTKVSTDCQWIAAMVEYGLSDSTIMQILDRIEDRRSQAKAEDADLS